MSPDVNLKKEALGPPYNLSYLELECVWLHAPNCFWPSKKVSESPS
jgi:hypothetical protein